MPQLWLHALSEACSPPAQECESRCCQLLSCILFFPSLAALHQAHAYSLLALATLPVSQLLDITCFYCLRPSHTATSPSQASSDLHAMLMSPPGLPCPTCPSAASLPPACRAFCQHKAVANICNCFTGPSNPSLLSHMAQWVKQGSLATLQLATALALLLAQPLVVYSPHHVTPSSLAQARAQQGLGCLTGVVSPHALHSACFVARGFACSLCCWHPHMQCSSCCHLVTRRHVCPLAVAA